MNLVSGELQFCYPPTLSTLVKENTNLCHNFKDLVCGFPHGRFCGFNLSCSIQNIHKVIMAVFN